MRICNLILGLKGLKLLNIVYFVYSINQNVCLMNWMFCDLSKELSGHSGNVPSPGRLEYIC